MSRRSFYNIFATLLALFLGMEALVPQAQASGLHLNAGLGWQRVAPGAEHTAAPVLYQLLFGAAGTPNAIAKFDGNPRHLTNSDITDANGVVNIGGLTLDGNTGSISFANTPIFPLATGSGDISGTYPSLTVTGLQGRAVSSTAPNTGQILQFNGAQWAPATASSGWQLNGNSGTGCTAPCTVFLGTTDSASLEMRVNNQRAFRIEPATSRLYGPSPSIIGGFNGNSTVGAGNTIAGGGVNANPNSASGEFGAVGGGINNHVSSFLATVSGGANNTASGVSSTVAGGLGNTASGDVSFAAGQLADTNGHRGAFVWSDSSSSAGVAASADNQFVARANGGVIFYSNGGVIFYTNSTLTSGVRLAPGGGAWSSLSDRNVKDHLAPVNSQALLAQVAALPITTWNYKTQDVSIRHIGPMAQDFFTAFKVGEDDRHITEIDEGGVALAAIQGLNQKLEQDQQELKQILEQKDEEIQLLKLRLEKLEAAMTATLQSRPWQPEQGLQELGEESK